MIFWEKLGVRVETVVGSLGMGYKVRLSKLPNVHNPYALSPISKYKGFSVPNTKKPSNFYSVNEIVQNLFLLFICDLFVFFNGEKPNETKIVQIEPFFWG